MKSDDVNRMIEEMSEKHVHKSDKEKAAFEAGWDAAMAECGAKLKEKDQFIKLLKEEVGFAERGYTKMGRNDG